MIDMILKGKLVINELHDELKKLEAENNTKFSNTQKVLLTTEGSITAILDVLYGKVSLFTLDQHFENATKEQAEFLNLKEGEEINYREVIIHRRGKPMIYARSYIPLSRCQEYMSNDLIKGIIPTGKILKKYKIESRREINEIKIETPDATLKELFNTSEDFLARRYIVIHDDEILLWTYEAFPISYFKEEL